MNPTDVAAQLRQLATLADHIETHRLYVISAGVHKNSTPMIEVQTHKETHLRAWMESMTVNRITATASSRDAVHVYVYGSINDAHLSVLCVALAQSEMDVCAAVAAQVAAQIGDRDGEVDIQLPGPAVEAVTA